MAISLAPFAVGEQFPGWDGGYFFYRAVERAGLEMGFPVGWAERTTSVDGKVPMDAAETTLVECDYHTLAAAQDDTDSDGSSTTSTRASSCPFSVRIEQVEPHEALARVTDAHLDHDHNFELPDGAIDELLSEWSSWYEEQDTAVEAKAVYELKTTRRRFNAWCRSAPVEADKQISRQDQVVADIRKFLAADKSRRLLAEAQDRRWLISDDERSSLLAHHGATAPSPPDRGAGDRLGTASRQRMSEAVSPEPPRKRRKVETEAPQAAAGSAPRAAQAAAAQTGRSRASSSLSSIAPSTASSVRPRSTPSQGRAPADPGASPRPACEVLDLADSDEDDIKPKREVDADPSIRQHDPDDSLQILLFSLPSPFPFIRFLPNLTHADIGITDAAQLLDIASSPADLDDLLRQLEEARVGAGGEALPGMPRTWTNALKRALGRKLEEGGTA